MTGPMPSRWEDVPNPVKREIARQLVRNALELHGWPNLVKSLYVGRADLGMTPSKTYGAEPAFFYPFLSDEAARSEVRRESK